MAAIFAERAGVGKVFAVVENQIIAAAQKLLQIGLDDVRLRPIKHVVIVAAREVNNFAKSSVTGGVEIISVIFANPCAYGKSAR